MKPTDYEHIRLAEVRKQYCFVICDGIPIFPLFGLGNSLLPSFSSLKEIEKNSF